MLSILKWHFLKRVALRLCWMWWSSHSLSLSTVSHLRLNDDQAANFFLSSFLNYFTNFWYQTFSPPPRLLQFRCHYFFFFFFFHESNTFAEEKFGSLACPAFPAVAGFCLTWALPLPVCYVEKRGCGSMQIANGKHTPVKLEWFSNICMPLRTNWPVCTFNESSGNSAWLLFFFRAHRCDWGALLLLKLLLSPTRVPDVNLCTIIFTVSNVDSCFVFPADPEWIKKILQAPCTLCDAPMI